jgi:hypothetical protein
LAFHAIAVEPIPETSGAERAIADVLAIGAPAAEAERVRDSVALWFHTFALAPGIYTPGVARDHGYRLPVLGADRFVGRSVLDVGAFDGFYSFLAEARGARRVVAVDNEQYVDWVRARFGVTVESGAVSGRSPGWSDPGSSTDAWTRSTCSSASTSPSQNGSPDGRRRGRLMNQRGLR